MQSYNQTEHDNYIIKSCIHNTTALQLTVF